MQERKNKPYIVVECKKEEVTEAEFQQAVNQAFSYAQGLATTTKYVWISKGNKEKFYKYDKDSQERFPDTDIPHFGQKDTLPFKFVKASQTYSYQGKKYKVEDIEKIEESDLVRIFKQAHDVLWVGVNSILRRLLMNWIN